MNEPEDRGARSTRRRWLSLGEAVAIVAVVISALTLWNNYQERSQSDAERRSEAVSSQRKAALLVLRATPRADGRTLVLSPHGDGQAIQDQTIIFPTALGLSPAQTSSDARIERSWFDSALIHARKQAGVDDRAPGDARLPILIVTHYLVDGDSHVDRAIYELGYATDHSLFGGTGVRLRGLSRVAPVAGEADGRKRIDALWASRTGTGRK